MKKTIATLMSLTAACAMFTPAFAVETESPTLISKPPAVISEAPEETTGRYTFEINGKDVPVDAVIIVPADNRRAAGLYRYLERRRNRYR